MYMSPASRLVDALVRRQGQELDEAVVVDQRGEDLRGLAIPTLAVGLAEQLAYLAQLLGDHRGDHRLVDLAAVVEPALRRADPLPDLRARNLGGRGVLHQIEDGHRALPRQPGAHV